MDNTNSFVSFDRLNICKYGVFQDAREFIFDHHRTFIVGGIGSGKTTISNALAHMEPAPKINSFSNTSSPYSSAKVSTRGNSDLIIKYKRLIFINGNPTDRDSYHSLSLVYEGPNSNIFNKEMKNIFYALLKNKPWKIKKEPNLEYENLAIGENICLQYAHIFASRRLLKLNLPLVIDTPYGCLDEKLTGGFSDFLKNERSQIVMLMSPQEYKVNQDASNTHYKLYSTR